MYSAVEHRQEATSTRAGPGTMYDQFIYAASHDLRSPVLTLRGFVQCLARDVDAGRTGELHNTLDYIKRATDQLSRYLDDLLALSRLDRGNLELVDLAASARMAATVLEAETGDLDIDVQIEDDADRIMGSRGGWQALFAAALSNAAQHGTIPGSSVEITATQSSDTESLRICIIDHGCGIAAEDRERVFCPFVKGRTNHDGGTGMGLAVVARVAALHDGTARIEETPGGGTTLVVEIPAARLCNESAPAELFLS